MRCRPACLFVLCRLCYAKKVMAPNSVRRKQRKRRSEFGRTVFFVERYEP